MDATLEQNLKETYPTLFKHLHNPPEDSPAVPLSVDGITCNDGWFALIDTLANTLENDYNDRLNEPIHAVQVKEKFGGLRFYTSATPPGVSALIHSITNLSKHTCELCGDTRTSLTRRDLGGRYQTLCDTHYYARQDLPDTCVIWGFDHECFNCGEYVPVVYPDPLGSNDGGSWSAVGPELAKKPYSSVEKTFSGTQRTFVWGNHCVECGSYLGNYFIREDAQSKSIAEKTRVDVISLDIPDNPV